MAANTFFDSNTFFTQEYADNPYPTLKLLRDNQPVYYNDVTKHWMVTRYEDVRKIFSDTENFSASPNGDHIGEVFGPTLMEYDGEDHRALRGVVAPEFVGLKLRSLLPIVQKNAMALVKKFTEKQADLIAKKASVAGEIDVVDDFATRLPLNVILDVLDLPQESHEMFHEWYPAMMNGISGGPELRAAGKKANSEYHAYLDPLIKQRSIEPGDDLLSRLSVSEVAGKRMTAEEIKSFASLILVAGAETTDKAIANLWYQLLSHPDQWDAVQEDPELLDRAFTEMMRIHGPAGAQTRKTLKDFSLHGVTIPAGEYVQLSLYGANRDERIFKDPDVFNIFREDLYFSKELRSGYLQSGMAGHLGFGLGPHFCVGYQLARAEAVIGTKILMEVIKNPRFKPGSKPQPIAIRIEPWHLHLEFDNE